MTFVTVAVITALCFVFASTRKYGVIGTGLLLYFQPLLAVGVLTVAGDHLFLLQEKFCMNIENHILDALETVSAWDVPDEDFADAVNSQIRLMMCVNPDDIREHPADTH